MKTLAELQAELVAKKAEFAVERETINLEPTETELRIAQLEVLIPNHPDNDPVQ